MRDGRADVRFLIRTFSGYKHWSESRGLWRCQSPMYKLVTLGFVLFLTILHILPSLSHWLKSQEVDSPLDRKWALYWSMDFPQETYFFLFTKKVAWKYINLLEARIRKGKSIYTCKFSKIGWFDIWLLIFKDQFTEIFFQFVSLNPR